MKIVVIGGSGQIGVRLVRQLTQRGHQGIPASPTSGVDTLTGAGLAAALKDAQVVIDATNPASFESAAVMHFLAHRHEISCPLKQGQRCSTTSCCRSSGQTVWRTSAICARKWLKNNWFSLDRYRIRLFEPRNFLNSSGRSPTWALKALRLGHIKGARLLFWLICGVARAGNVWAQSPALPQSFPVR